MESESVFVTYLPMPACRTIKHPEKLVETKILSSFNSINPNPLSPIANCFVGKVPLSGPQMESIHLADLCHGKFLSNGTRQGYIIGDGAGVGKGRQIAGIIVNNFFHLRKKSIWISASKDLIVDAQRDMKEVSSKANLAIKVFKPPKDFTRITQKEGVLFVSYTFLSSKRTSQVSVNESESETSSDEFQNRYNQILDWLSDSFDGVIVFDESHKAKGYDITSSLSTSVGSCVHNLQVDIPKSRIVYVSATLACYPEEMAYMERCGLWGGKSAFPTSSEFICQLNARGIAALEHLPLEMKERQIFLSRHLSMDGVSFSTSLIPLQNGFEKLYEDSCTMWMLLHREALQIGDKRTMSHFHAECQRFFKSLCVSAKVQGAVHKTQEALANGKAVIIGLQSTGEAGYNRFRTSVFHSTTSPYSKTRMILEELLIEKLGYSSSELGLKISKKDGDLTLYHSQSPSLRKTLKAKRRLERKQTMDTDSEDDEQNISSSATLLSYLEILESIETLDLKKEISLRFRNLESRLPLNPLDVLIRDLGGLQKVVELTGRVNYQKLEKGEDGLDIGCNVKRDAGSTGINITEQRRFQSGLADVVIISEAASTGISLHSNRKFKNQKPRLHIMLEFPWSASVAIQQLGRSNRSNQAHVPEYILLMSSITAEIRFANAVGQRMASMGALSKGDKRSSSDVWTEFDLDSFVAKEAIKNLLKYFTGKNRRLNLFLETPEHQKLKQSYCKMLCELDILKQASSTDIKINSLRTTFERFMNRILAIPINLQKSVVSWFTICLENFKDDDEEYQLVSSIADIKEEIKGKITLSSTKTKEFLLPDGYISKIVYFEELSGLSYQELEGKLDKVTFYKQPPVRLVGDESVIAVEKVAFSMDPNRFSLKVYSPLSKKPFMKPLTYIGERSGFYEITRNEGKLLWLHQYNLLRRGICQNEFMSKQPCQPQPCTHPKSVKQFAIVRGGCLNLWHSIESVMKSKKIKLVKCEIDNQFIVGIFVDSASICNVEGVIKGIVERDTF